MYIPHTDTERQEMLRAIGVDKIEDLFSDVPQAHRFPTLDLPPALSEMEIAAEMQAASETNFTTRMGVSFLGAGAYNHYIPAAVDSILRRGEFYTAYTPYQPEISQGTLQAIFEYQSLIANLTGMEICNASHYDGATATAEAVILAYHHFRGKRPKVVLAPFVNPQFRAVVHTYLQGNEAIHLVEPDASENPLISPAQIEPLIDDSTSLVIIQYPDFFGRILDFSHLVKTAHAAGALVACVAYPLSLGLLKSPGDFGIDMVVGEGQSLGLPLSFGGPYLGIFATRKDLIRKVSGRLVGETSDAQGRRGYVLTLTAREQHIKRDKATSNICSNQGLMALASAVYLSLVGKCGLKQVASLCYQKAHYAAKLLAELNGYEVIGSGPYFNEIILRCPQPIDDIIQGLLEFNIIGGYPLGRDYEALEDCMLLSFTEMNTREDIDYLRDALQEINDD